ncbi:hypothetical protein [Thermus sp.]|uniref:hypothetical protein n=1 Tax=Thermus sp. TaxID=275 RepID=UPI00307D8807
MRVRRKGLALLYYLALEGPTRRALLADLLWGHGAALQNLRVELHALNRVLGGSSSRAAIPWSCPRWWCWWTRRRVCPWRASRA